MMIERSGTDLKAQRGDRLTAEMWNRMARNVESLNDTAIGMQTGAGIKAPASGLILRAENVSTVTIDPFHVATIKGQAYGDPIGQWDIVLQIATPSGESNPWAIVLDSIPSNSIGRVLALGVGWAEYAPASSGAFATVTEGSHVLTLGDEGAGQVIETHPSEPLVLVRFPAGTGNAGGSTIERHAHRSRRWGHTVGL